MSGGGGARRCAARVRGTEPFCGWAWRWRALYILSLKVSDSGEYTREYDDGGKAPRVFGPIDVQVVKAAPVAGAWGRPGLIAVILLTARVCIRGSATRQPSADLLSAGNRLLAASWAGGS